MQDDYRVGDRGSLDFAGGIGQEMEVEIVFFFRAHARMNVAQERAISQAIRQIPSVYSVLHLNRTSAYSTPDANAEIVFVRFWEGEVPSLDTSKDFSDRAKMERMACTVFDRHSEFGTHLE
jgi:hypothetical protein